MVNPHLQVTIDGEANVARYLSRLLNPAYDDCDPLMATEIDTLIDSARVIKYGPPKMKASVVKGMNVRLGKNQWLVNNVITLADIVLWSALTQLGEGNKQTGNVKKWMEKASQNMNFKSAASALL